MGIMRLLVVEVGSYQPRLGSGIYQFNTWPLMTDVRTTTA